MKLEHLTRRQKEPLRDFPSQTTCTVCPQGTFHPILSYVRSGGFVRPGNGIIVLFPRSTSIPIPLRHLSVSALEECIIDELRLQDG